MTPQRFEQFNVVLTAPRGLPDGKCGDLHACRSNGHLVTCWQPTPEERAQLVAGAPVWLTIMGDNMAPVSLTVESPFVDDPSPERLAEIQAGADACIRCRHFDHPRSFCWRWGQESRAAHLCEHFEGDL